MKAFYANGTPDLDGWCLGEEVKSLKDVKVGDVLLQLCHQFKAQNLCRITSLDKVDFRGPDAIRYAVFVDPDNTDELRAPGDAEFAIWCHDLKSNWQSYYRVSRERPAMKLSGAGIRRLMRQHKVKMRDLKARHGITLKRIREVRASGVRGFNAEEWFKMITGEWPDTGWSEKQIRRKVLQTEQPSSNPA